MLYSSPERARQGMRPFKTENTDNTVGNNLTQLDDKTGWQLLAEKELTAPNSGSYASKDSLFICSIL